MGIWVSGKRGKLTHLSKKEEKNTPMFLGFKFSPNCLGIIPEERFPRKEV